MATAQPSGTRAFFAKRLRELRIPKGFRTARKLATELGIDENRYTRYERAEVEPDLELLVRIAEALEVTPNDLLGVLTRAPSARGFEDGAGQPVQYDGFTSILPDRGGRGAAMWAFAREVALVFEAGQVRAEFGVDQDLPASGNSLEQLQLIASLYRKMDADLFGFVSQFSLSPLLAGLAGEQQDRFAKLIERVTG